MEGHASWLPSHDSQTSCRPSARDRRALFLSCTGDRGRRLQPASQPASLAARAEKPWPQFRRGASTRHRLHAIVLGDSHCRRNVTLGSEMRHREQRGTRPRRKPPIITAAILLARDRSETVQRRSRARWRNISLTGNVIVYVNPQGETQHTRTAVVRRQLHCLCPSGKGLTCTDDDKNTAWIAH